MRLRLLLFSVFLAGAETVGVGIGSRFNATSPKLIRAGWALEVDQPDGGGPWWRMPVSPGFLTG